MILNRSFTIIFSALLSLAANAGEILFVDINNGKAEIEAARKAAASKGDKLIVIPKEGQKFSLEEFDATVKANSFKSLIISGHSGGDEFTGHGSEVKVKIEDLIKSLRTPNSSSIQTLYLLGCYTANKAKIPFWKASLPNLKFLAGFNGQGPLNTNPASAKYISDLLKKEDSIIKSSHEKGLENILKNINILRNVDASLYISCQPGEYFYGSLIPDPKKRLTKYEATQCTEQIDQFTTKYRDAVRQYKSGELEPTTENTNTGILRKAYALALQSEHCLVDEFKELAPEIDPHALRILLFNKSFNQNFATYYKDLIQQALSELELSETDPETQSSEVLKEAIKKHNIYNGFVQRKDAQKLIQQEDLQKRKIYEDYVKSHPGLKDCVDWSRNCNFPNSVLTRAEQLRMSYWSLPKKLELTGLEEVRPLKVDAKTLKPLLQKMLQNSSEITRRDFQAVAKVLSTMEGSSVHLRKLEMRVQEAIELNQKYPFSWHEYNEKHFPESPTPSRLIPENKELAQFLDLHIGDPQ